MIFRLFTVKFNTSPFTFWRMGCNERACTNYTCHLTLTYILFRWNLECPLSKMLKWIEKKINGNFMYENILGLFCVCSVYGMYVGILPWNYLFISNAGSQRERQQSKRQMYEVTCNKLKMDEIRFRDMDWRVSYSSKFMSTEKKVQSFPMNDNKLMQWKSIQQTIKQINKWKWIHEASKRNVILFF